MMTIFDLPLRIENAFEMYSNLMDTNFQGVVNSIVSNSPSDFSVVDLLNSDHPDKAVEIRSPLNYEFTSGQYNSPSVRGRLSLCYDQWVKLGASGFILSIVRDGYKIPFVTLPPPKVSPNSLCCYP